MTRNSKEQNQKKYEVLLFDLGATLLYFDSEFVTINPIADEALFQQLTSLGYHVDKSMLAKKLYNLESSAFDERSKDLKERTTDTILKSTLSSLGIENVPQSHLKIAVKTMLSVYESHWQVGDDTIATLEQLQGQGYRMGVISNASDYDNVMRLMDKGNLHAFFELTLVSSKEGLRKPDPQMFRKAMDYFKTTPQQTVMIGDTLDADILGAKKLGIKTVWIKRWADTPQNRFYLSQVKPDATIMKLGELPDLLVGWKK